MLEKSRVVRQAPAERSFHIFYQLLFGAQPELKSKLQLTKPQDYEFLKGADSFTVKTFDDKDEFAHTLKAMDIMAFTQAEQESVFRIIAGILHLGNIKIETYGGEGSVINEKAAVAQACEVMGIDPQRLELAITKPVSSWTLICHSTSNLSSENQSRKRAHSNSHER